MTEPGYDEKNELTQNQADSIDGIALYGRLLELTFASAEDPDWDALIPAVLPLVAEDYAQRGEPTIKLAPLRSISIITDRPDNPLQRLFRVLLAEIGRVLGQTVPTQAIARLESDEAGRRDLGLLFSASLEPDDETLSEIALRLSSESTDAGASPDESDRDDGPASAEEETLGLLRVIGSLLTIPPFQRYGRQARKTLPSDVPLAGWGKSVCPVCGALPLIIESRGVERSRYCRCGRCDQSWRVRGGECLFCGQSHPRKLGYLAAEEIAESLRAETCDDCLNYIKLVSVFETLRGIELHRRDLFTLALDKAAIERGFRHPKHS